MPYISGKNDLGSRLAWLLFVPCFSILILAISTTHQYMGGVAVSWLKALRLSAGAYEVALAVLLFAERNSWPQTPENYRLLEVSIGGFGLIVSALSVIRFFKGGALSELQFGAFGVVASATVMIPRRTDWIRSIAFAAMAVVEARSPFVAVHPPFVFMSVLCAAAAIICLVHVKAGRTALRRVFSVGTVLGVLMTLMSVSAFSDAYQNRWRVAMVISIVGILYFVGGTIVIVARGDWFERHRKR